MKLRIYVTINHLFYNLVTAEIFHTSIGIPSTLREVHEMVKMWQYASSTQLRLELDGDWESDLGANFIGEHGNIKMKNQQRQNSQQP
jgi:hypothetical protein